MDFTQFFLCLTYFFLLYYNVAIHTETLYLLKGEYYYEKESHIAGAAVFFAVFRSLANIADSTVLSHLGLSKNIYSMMPFIASMIILAFTSKNSQAPKAEGIPYDKGAR